MRITFVLPSPARIPMGGAKVVYAHAAGLAAGGHEVRVVGPRRGGDRWRDRLWEGAVRIRDLLHQVADVPYYAEEGVETLVVGSVGGGAVPDGEAVIATGWQTARWVAELPPSKGAKLYFIQGHEAYQSEEALRTWHLGLGAFTCSEWLAHALRAEGVPVLGVVPNAIDPEEYFLEQPVPSRSPSVIWLYHRAAVKGPRDGIAVLEQLRERWPGLRADVFSARPPSHRLPEWVNLHLRPSVAHLRALYNRSALVLQTSHVEGWSLVPMEGIACGCAAVGYANAGIQEYLRDGESAVLVPVGDVEALVEAAHGLLADPDERVRVAGAGLEAVASFDWARSTAHLEHIITSVVAGSPASNF